MEELDLKRIIMPEEDKEGQESFATLLALDDEEFSQISPFVLAELVKTFDDVTFRKTVLLPSYDQIFEGKDLTDERKKVFEAIDSLKEDFSEVKRDFLKRICIIGFNAYEDELERGMQKISVPIVLSEQATMPTYGSEEAAGIDLYATEDITINPGETKIVPTGIKVALPKGYALLIHPRSGLSARTHLRVANSIGLIDSDYRDEIGVILENTAPKISNIIYDFDEKTNFPIVKAIEEGPSYTISKGDRFAQMRLVKAPQINFMPVSDLLNIRQDRGGGFGHSGK